MRLNRTEWRPWIALSICLGSAMVLAYLCLFQGYSPVSAGVALWLIWFQVASWLGNRLQLLWNSPREIVRRVSVLRLTGLALGIERASFVWLTAAGVMFFVR